MNHLYNTEYGVHVQKRDGNCSYQLPDQNTTGAPPPLEASMNLRPVFLSLPQGHVQRDCQEAGRRPLFIPEERTTTKRDCHAPGPSAPSILLLLSPPVREP